MVSYIQNANHESKAKFSEAHGPHGYTEVLLPVGGERWWNAMERITQQGQPHGLLLGRGQLSSVGSERASSCPVSPQCELITGFEKLYQKRYFFFHYK